VPAAAEHDLDALYAALTAPDIGFGEGEVGGYFT
jgi:hypothetical protein